MPDSGTISVMESPAHPFLTKLSAAVSERRLTPGERVELLKIKFPEGSVPSTFLAMIEKVKQGVQQGNETAPKGLKAEQGQFHSLREEISQFRLYLSRTCGNSDDPSWASTVNECPGIGKA